MILALGIASVIYATIYAGATGRYSIYYGIAPLALLVITIAAIVYLPIYALLNRYRPSVSPLRSIIVSLAISIAFITALFALEYISAMSTKATITIDGGTTFVDGVPTEFWCSGVLKSLLVCTLAATFAGYAFWFVFVRAQSKGRSD